MRCYTVSQPLALQDNSWDKVWSPETIHAMDNRMDRLQVPILLRIKGKSTDWFSVSIQGNRRDEIQRHILLF